MVASLSVQLKKKKQQRQASSTTSSTPNSSAPTSPKERSPSNSVTGSPVLTAAQKKKKKYREKKKQNALLSTQTTDSSDPEDSASEKEMAPTATAAPGNAALKEDLKSAISLGQKNPPNSNDSTASVSSFRTASGVSPPASTQTTRDTTADDALDESDPKFFDSVASLLNMTASIARVGSEQVDSKTAAVPETEEHQVDSLAEKIVQHEAPSFADVAAHRENAPDVSELPPVVPKDLASVTAHQVAPDSKPASAAEPIEGNQSVDTTTTLTQKIEERKAPDFASVAANKARVPEEVKVAAEIVDHQVIASERQHIADLKHETPLTDKTPVRTPKAVEKEVTGVDVDIETPLSEKISERKAPLFADVTANKAQVPKEIIIAADIVAENVAATEKQHILETTVVDTATPLPEKIEQQKAPSFASVTANKAHVPMEVKLAADITADKVHSKEEEIVSAHKLANEIDTETTLAEKIDEHRAPSFADVAGDRAHVPEAVTISADLVAEHVREEEVDHIKELKKQQKAAEELAKEKRKAEKAAKEQAAKSAAIQKQNTVTSGSTSIGNGNTEDKSRESKKMPTATLLDQAETKLNETLDKAIDTLVTAAVLDHTPSTPAPSTTSTVAASPSTTHHETREIFVAHSDRLTSTSERRYSTGETESEYTERRRREHKINRALENRRKLGLASLVFGNATIGAVVGAITVVALAATGGNARLRWMSNVTKTRASGVGIAVGAAMGLIEWIWLGKRQSAATKNE